MGPPPAFGKLWERDLNLNTVSSELKAFACKTHGTVRTLRWDVKEEKKEATLLLAKFASERGFVHTEPVLIKGAVAHWHALETWSLDALAKAYPEQRVAVRIAPGPRFPYVEPTVMPLYLKLHKASDSPSILWRGMPLWYFAARMQADRKEHGLGDNLVYSGGEQYYLQSLVWRELGKDMDLKGPPFTLLSDQGESGAEWVTRQVARLWLSPQGAVSPTHYDTATSFLTQISGRKRIYLWKPDDLQRLYPYSKWHMLRRRSRVDPTCPDYKRFPKAEKASALEATLEPGDVLFFPGMWMHYTESLDLSTSMTYRVGPKVKPTARRFFGLRFPHSTGVPACCRKAMFV